MAKAVVKKKKDLRSFIGACIFFRRHVRNFTETSAELTDLTKKDAKWELSESHEAKFQELKRKIVSTDCLGVPRAYGDFLLVTDACNFGGGGTIFQWQDMDVEQVRKLPDGVVHGVNRDGTLRLAEGLERCYLVPIGHWNWK